MSEVNATTEATVVETTATVSTKKAAEKAPILYSNLDDAGIKGVWSIEKLRYFGFSMFTNTYTKLVSFVEASDENLRRYYESKDFKISMEKFMEVMDNPESLAEVLDEADFVEFAAIDVPTATKLGSIVMKIANTRFPSKEKAQRKFSEKAQELMGSFTIADLLFNSVPQGCEFPPKKAGVPIPERMDTLKELNKLGVVTEKDLYEIFGDVTLRDFIELGGNMF